MEFRMLSNQIIYTDTEQHVLAEVTFPQIRENVVNINHTYVDDSLRGQGVAGQLLEAVAKQLRSQNQKAVPSCSYAIAWFGKHPEYADILDISTPPEA